MPSNALDKVFNTLYREIKERWSGDLVSTLRQVLLGLQLTQVWPDDDSLRRSIVEERLYTDRRNDRVKLILESLAENLSKEQIKTESLSVEHIMPQTLTDEWRAMLGANANEQYEKWLHTLGNLTLTAYNPELSNKPFAEKLEYLSEKSSFALNQYFRNVNAWNASEIQRRGHKLAEIAVQVWPR
ncbi:MULTISPECIES: HNH endonuclease family protein [Trichocoleus]|nr:HNH endonuclease family protein [Trichocoleus sp. FACHB-46]